MNITQNITQPVGDALIRSFDIIFKDVLTFIPNILLAFLVLTVLVWIAKIVSKLIGDLLRLARIDALLARVGVTQAFHEVGFQVSIAYGVQIFIRYILIFVALLSTFAILGLDQVVGFLEYSLFQILPNVIVLGLMLFFTVVLANKTREFVSHSSYVAKHHTPFLANVIWFMIIVFGLIATLQEMEIFTFITDTANGFVQALSLGVALALGLAFGLGCKEEARCLIRSWMGKDCYDLDCGCNTFGCKNCSGMDDSHDFDCDCDNCSIEATTK